ncbi:hypothetical protein ABIC84_003053 [Mucilaginibacter sp. 3215]
MLKVHYSVPAMKKHAADHAKKLLPIIKFRLKKTDNKLLAEYFKTDALIKEFLSATPRKLLNLNELIYTSLKHHAKSDIADAAQRVFNYDEFGKRNRAKYRADNMCKTLDFKTCPYCNLTKIGVTLNKAGVVISRPPLDHFFSDAKFPLLALSFYNLIPACTTCNTNFKLGATMSLSKNTHPYINGFENECVFDIANFKDIDDILGKKEGPFDLVFDNKFKKKKYNGNISLFKLEDQYGTQKDSARIVLNKAISYGPSILKNIFKLSHQNPLKAFEHAFGSKIKPTEFHHIPLSKMNSDIIRKYGNNKLKKIFKIT